MSEERLRSTGATRPSLSALSSRLPPLHRRGLPATLFLLPLLLLLLLLVLFASPAFAQDDPVVDKIRISTSTYVVSGSCTGSRRVCWDFEQPSAYCQENKLRKKTVRITPGSWWGSVYDAWIAQIIIMEQLQVPVEVVPSMGGNYPFYRPQSSKPDALPGRRYDWDGLDNAFASMGCSAEYIESLPVPAAFKDATQCQPPRPGASPPPMCKPCTHAMLEVWSGEERELAPRLLETRTAEHAGTLGVEGQLGWFTTEGAVEREASMASWRGLKRYAGLEVHGLVVRCGLVLE